MLYKHTLHDICKQKLHMQTHKLRKHTYSTQATLKHCLCIALSPCVLKTYQCTTRGLEGIKDYRYTIQKKSVSQKHWHAGSSHYIATFCLSSVVPHTGSFTDINTNRLSYYGLHYSYWWGYIFNQNQHGILNSECQWKKCIQRGQIMAA